MQLAGSPKGHDHRSLRIEVCVQGQTIQKFTLKKTFTIGSNADNDCVVVGCSVDCLPVFFWSDADKVWSLQFTDMMEGTICLQGEETTYLDRVRRDPETRQLESRVWMLPLASVLSGAIRFPGVEILFLFSRPAPSATHADHSLLSA